jgi:NAD(P)H-hydrate epimerase
MAMDKPTNQLRLTCAQCREVDQYAIEELGIPGVVLMENAGRNAADLIEERLADRPGAQERPGRIAVVCGGGNNGGDGFVVARHLTHRGHEVWIDLMADPARLAGDAAVNHAIVQKMGVPIRPLCDLAAIPTAVHRWHRSDVIVDALLGTGFAGAVREPMAEVIRQINGLSGPLVVAIDVPSGLDADTGQVAGEAVRAHQTVTFLAEKSGYARESARAYTGRITVVDIGAPTMLILSRLAAAQ